LIIIIKDKFDQALRSSRQHAVEAGEFPDFRADTAALREGEWRVASPCGCDSGPAHYLAGLQSAGEAEAWRDSLEVDAPIRGTGIILWLDSIWAAFEAEEILHALKDLVCKVVCDSDGYLFSFIETFSVYPEFVLPDRADITPGTHFLESFTRLVGTVCRRREVAAVGVTGEESVLRGRVEAADLLLVPRGRITEQGIRQNIRLALTWFDGGTEGLQADDEAQLRRRSAARLAAAQLWQWINHDTGVLDEGRIVTGQLFEHLLADEASTARSSKNAPGGADILAGTVLARSFNMSAFA